MRKILLILIIFFFTFAGTNLRLSPKLSNVSSEYIPYFFGIKLNSTDDVVLFAVQNNVFGRDLGGSSASVLKDHSGNNNSGNDNNLTQDTVDNQPTVSDNYRTFDGTNDYMHQKVYDTNQGAMTFIADGGSAEFRDAGQDFSDYETTSGNASYMIVITTDNGVSWGYMGASNNSGLDIDIYSDIGLTTRGWKGRTTPQATPDTPASYEVRKTDFQITTGNISIILWIKPDDGQPASHLFVLAKDGGNGFRTWYVHHRTDGSLRFYISEDGTNVGGIFNTDNLLADGAQSSWTMVGFTYNVSTQKAYMVINGIVPAINTNDLGKASFFDSNTPLMVSVAENQPFYYKGKIAMVLVIYHGTNDPLTLTQIQTFYNNSLISFSFLSE